ncbi:MAG: synthase subunit [Bacteriovoracaceae bacterium]|nr:synthase subunit [Bacteriovoracaceae bacterium]
MSEKHETLLQLVGVPHEYNHVVGAGLVAVALAALGLHIKSRLKNLDANILPEPKVSLLNISTSIVGAFKNLLDSMIGHGAEKFVPMIGSIFLFILLANLSGLIPGFPPPTENINTNFGIAILSLIAFVGYGFKEHGLFYIKQFTGGLPPKGYSGGITALLTAIAGLVFLIEIVGQILIRPISLTLRLWGNINGDHTLIGVFNGLIPLFVPIIFLVLGIFVSVIQSLVFSLLTAVYIKLAVSHDH